MPQDKIEVQHSAARRAMEKSGVPLDHSPNLSNLASSRQNFDERAKANAAKVA